MTFLLKISKYILFPIITEWIDLVSFTTLDSALCCDTSRQLFMNLLMTHPTVLQCMFDKLESIPFTIALCAWYIRRGLNLKFSQSLLVGNKVARKIGSAVLEDSQWHYLLAGTTCISIVNYTDNAFTFSQIVEACVNVEAIDVCYCTNFNLNCLQSVASRLREIRFRNCKQLNDDLLIALLRQSGPILETLVIEYCDPVNVPVYLAILVHCRCLTALTLNNVEVTLDRVISKLLFHFPTQRLRAFESWDLTVCDLRWLAHTQSSTLTSLNVSVSREVTDEAVREMASLCPLLTSVSLSYCYRVSDVGVSAIAHYLPLLRKIDLSCLEELTNNALETLFLCCTHLRELRMYNSPFISNDEELWNKLPENVNTLCLSQMYISPRSLLDLLKRGTITSLDLSYNNSTQLFATLGASGQTSLTYLSLYGCENMTDDSVIALSSCLVNVTDLNIGMCRKLTESGALVAIQSCSALKALQLPFNEFTVSMQICTALIEKHRKALKILDVRGVRKFPFEIALQLVLWLPKLREFLLDHEHTERLVEVNINPDIMFDRF